MDHRPHNKTAFIIITAIVFLAMTATVFAIDRTHVSYYCSDVRRFMDGGYGATVSRGGFNSRSHLEFYQAWGFGHDRKTLDVASADVDRLNPGSEQKLVAPQKSVVLTMNDKWVQDRGYLTVVDARTTKGPIQAKLWCTPPRH